MTDNKVVLLFINDFSGQSGEKLYLYSNGVLTGVAARDVVEVNCEIICHDYWLLAPTLFSVAGRLPSLVTDVDELRISTSGIRSDREARDKVDVCTQLLELGYEEEEVLGRYRNIVFKNSDFDDEVFSRVAIALLKYSARVEAEAKEHGEWDRYCQIERPVISYLIRSAADGISINKPVLKIHKQDVDFSYYMALKEFSATYDLPLEVPTDEEVIEHLEPQGYDFSGVGLEYVLNFVPMPNGFSEKLIELRKIAASRMVLGSISLSQDRIYPVVDGFGSITSRIYYKDPSLQNLSKRFRDVISPAEGKRLSYVDFGQFEAGIMAALSGDEAMLTLYRQGDVYESVAVEVFGDPAFRKQGKRLFLSYAYGMKRRNLIDAAVGYGACRDSAKEFFNKFVRFERWKSEIHSEFHSSGKIGTAFGNFVRRSSTAPLSEKEKRSAVSQVVQGTASLIFKKALIRMSLDDRVALRIPMHDAVLFEHSPEFNPIEIVNMFSGVMTEHFDGAIEGKAEIAVFAQN
ncbi:DNA polymerase [Stenotrophomonas sp. YAU14A_MKIMI4_1]|uniref:DNA polymerase n=1 Tax=Stenotrophomonas sp. YAU14A_MKIMI4_1 TaxID=2072408 RepID=UPI000D53FE68|nr:DNA polymerase [Stenotrophomonas sp. YAU14A_MKIMI4_1]AWH28961.1 DNA polymerase I [Stenotrophomonas sp. YAU14A_MKIMI4_1]